jgi:hypothetical protein
MKKTSLRATSPSGNPIVVKTVIITTLVILVGAGLFVLGLKSGKGNTMMGGIRRSDAVPGEVPFGDEDLDMDKQYQEAMNNVGQGTLYASPFGYTVILPKDWHAVDTLTFDNEDGKREAFSPYSNAEIDEVLKNDPYNANYYLEVEIRDNPKNISLAEWTTKSDYSPQAMGQQNFDTTIAGYPAVKVIGNQGDAYVDYYVKVGTKVFNLGYFFTEGDQWRSPSQFSIKVFEDIISSFKTL